ncbi:MAG: PD-(D/E)XK nuclease family protein [Bacteroidales bacterium]
MKEKGIVQIKQMNIAINFNDELIDENKNHLIELLLFLDEFNQIYINEAEKLPYHINLIDELHANENAHSRILGKLLLQQEPINKRHEILESFLNYIIRKYSNKEDFSKIKINKPNITQEKRRIDLWIRDNNYAIIFENKVGWAGDQLYQLERYIDVTKEYNFKEEEIYILYLPPTYEKEPNKQSWGKYYEQDIYKKRYLNLSFKDDILDWLKKDVLQIVRKKDYFLSSSIEQYIDHLEGKFSLREINNKMNMELQNFIKEKLGINEYDKPEDATKILSEKEEELNNAISQIQQLKSKFQKQIVENHFVEWEKLLEVDFPYLKIVGDRFTFDRNVINIGIKLSIENKEFVAIIECNNCDKLNIYFGIGRKFLNNEKFETSETLQKILTHNELSEPEDLWYGWKYTSLENAYSEFKILINQIISFK